MTTRIPVFTGVSRPNVLSRGRRTATRIETKSGVEMSTADLWFALLTGGLFVLLALIAKGSEHL
jgi:hypothetical protein